MIFPLEYIHIILIFVTLIGILLYTKQNKVLNNIQVQLKIILTALDTDIRNNINLEKQLTEFLLDYVNLDLTLQHEWVLYEYFQRQRDNVIRGYKNLKEDINLLNSQEYQIHFLGNGGAKLRDKLNTFPEEFINSLHTINVQTFTEFKYIFLMQDMYSDIKQRKFFSLKLLTINSFKDNVKLTLKSYDKYKHLINQQDTITEYKLHFSTNIIDTLHDLGLTLKKLQSIKNSIDPKFENKYLLILNELENYISKDMTYSNDERRTLDARLRNDIINLMKDMS